MIWSPGAVYGFVRAAGFGAVQWAQATALALATSGGDDLYRDVAWPGPAVDRRGLFGIDVVRFGQYAADDLLNPATNAKVALALTRSCDGLFDWSAVPVPTPGSEAFTEAAAAVRAGVVTQPLASGFGVSSVAGLDPGELEQLAGISDYVRSRIRTGG